MADDRGLKYDYTLQTVHGPYTVTLEPKLTDKQWLALFGAATEFKKLELTKEQT